MRQPCAASAAPTLLSAVARTHSQAEGLSETAIKAFKYNFEKLTSGTPQSEHLCLSKLAPRVAKRLHTHTERSESAHALRSARARSDRDELPLEDRLQRRPQPRLPECSC